MANLNFDVGLTCNFVSTAMVAGTTSTYTTTVTSNACVNGKFATALTAQTNTATPTTDANTGVAFRALAPNQCCALVLGLTAAGAIAMVQGEILATATGVTTTVGAFVSAPQFPTLPNNFVALAYTVVRTAPSAAAWVPGTGSWTASGVSATTFANVSQLPNRPQIA